MNGQTYQRSDQSARTKLGRRPPPSKLRGRVNYAITSGESSALLKLLPKVQVTPSTGKADIFELRTQ